MNQLLLFCGIVIVTCLLIKPVAKRLPFPTLIVFVALGMLFGVNGPLHIDFENYALTEGVCCTALMFIMFYGGFNTNLELARPVAVRSVLLSTVGVLITAGLTGAFAHLVFGMDWIASLLLGSCVASTDAASVFSVLREHKLSLKGGTDSMLELESGSNDPLSYMLTVVFATLAAGHSVNVPVLLAQQIGIGIVCGLAIGSIACGIFDRFGHDMAGSEIIALVGVAVVAYALPNCFGGSGFLSVYLAGMVLGHADVPAKREAARFFDVLCEMAEMAIFFLIGLLVTPARLPEMILPALGLLVFMLFIGRPMAVGAVLAPFRASLRQMALVSWAGLRGAASVVFVLYAVVEGVPGAYDLFDLVFLVAVLSIVVQGSLLPAAARKLDMVDASANVMRTFNDYQEESSLSFVKIKVEAEHPFVGKTLAEAGSIENMLVVLILRNGSEPLIPGGDTRIEIGDLLVLAAPTFEKSEQIELREFRIGARHRWANRALRDLPAERRRFVVVMLRREGRDIIPNGDTVILPGDDAVVASLA